MLTGVGDGWKKVRGGKTKTWHQCLKSLTSSLSYVGRCRLLGWGPRDYRNLWFRIDYNSVGVYTLCLPLNYEIKIASYLSFYVLILSSCTISLYAIFLLYTNTIELTAYMNLMFVLLC
ncbi:unnamed protein product [Schistosoma mattheei]|uniref:Uncharacterized protein n=1 Tax=Schistosoma mattheei TaxID=31246 RepID=A0A183NSZ3_9TREM|nr:unnamed protein product [Schistosoma mattheei]